MWPPAQPSYLSAGRQECPAFAAHQVSGLNPNGTAGHGCFTREAIIPRRRGSTTGENEEDERGEETLVTNEEEEDLRGEKVRRGRTEYEEVPQKKTRRKGRDEEADKERM